MAMDCCRTDLIGTCIWGVTRDPDSFTHILQNMTAERAQLIVTCVGLACFGCNAIHGQLVFNSTHIFEALCVHVHTDIFLLGGCQQSFGIAAS